MFMIKYRFWFVVYHVWLRGHWTRVWISRRLNDFSYKLTLFKI